MVDKTPVVVCTRILGIQLYRLSVVGNGSVVNGFLRVAVASFELRFCILTLQPYCLRVVRNGSVVIAFAFVGDASVVEIC